MRTRCSSVNLLVFIPRLLRRGSFATPGWSTFSRAGQRGVDKGRNGVGTRGRARDGVDEGRLAPKVIIGQGCWIPVTVENASELTRRCVRVGFCCTAGVAQGRKSPFRRVGHGPCGSGRQIGGVDARDLGVFAAPARSLSVA